MEPVNVYIYGAKATATGLHRAISKLYVHKCIKGFIVTNKTGNPLDIYGINVTSLQEISSCLSDDEKIKARVYIATPEIYHDEISRLLIEAGFKKIIRVDSKKESHLMEHYYEADRRFVSVHNLLLIDKNISIPNISIYVACFYKDKHIENLPRLLSCCQKLFLGCSTAKQFETEISGKADFYDDTGDNISAKNPNRCEMTAHYWIWKNRLDTDDEYVGVYHYRRFLDMSDDDLRRMKVNDVDVVLPFPMIHYPSALIHHTWYVREEDWQVMRQVLRELYPEYDARFDEIFAQPYFYNYNIMIAKKSVFADYCAWLFPILDAIEERSEPKGKDRADRYTAYMSESLTTLYFMYHQQDLKIYHTGRLLYT